MRALFQKMWNREIAIGLGSSAIRLEHWLARNEKCIGCTKGSGRKFKKSEYDFQRGKQYAYLYCLEQMEYVKFVSPGTLKEGYEEASTPMFLSTGIYRQFYMEKELFKDVMNSMKPDLRKSILDFRNKTNEKLEELL